MALYLYGTSRPRVTVEGRLHGTNVLRRRGARDDVETPDDGWLIVRVDESLYFANADHVRRSIADALGRARGNRAGAARPEVGSDHVDYTPPCRRSTRCSTRWTDAASSSGSSPSSGMCGSGSRALRHRRALRRRRGQLRRRRTRRRWRRVREAEVARGSGGPRRGCRVPNSASSTSGASRSASGGTSAAAPPRSPAGARTRARGRRGGRVRQCRIGGEIAHAQRERRASVAASLEKAPCVVAVERPPLVGGVPRSGRTRPRRPLRPTPPRPSRRAAATDRRRSPPACRVSGCRRATRTPC